MQSGSRYPFSLSQRCTVVIAALLFAMILAQSALNVWSQQRAEEERLERQAAATAAMVGKMTSAYLAEGRIDRIQGAIQDLSLLHGLLHLSVSDASGHLIAHAEHESIPPAPLVTLTHSASQNIADEGQVLHVIEPLFRDGRRIAEVRLSLPLKPLSERLAAVLFQSGALGLGCLLLGSIVAWRLLDRVSRTLREVAASADSVSQGKFSQRLDVRTGDELEDLAAAFNRMLDELHRITISRDHMSEALRSMSEAMMLLSPAGEIRTVNPAACRLLGYSEAELLERPFDSLLAPSCVKPKGDLLMQLKRQGGLCQYETQYLDKHGAPIAVLFSGSITRDGAGKPTGIVCLAQDNRARKLREREVEHLAYFDSLTGLPNRVHFRQHLAKALAVAADQRQRLAVLFLDLDRFKSINDTFGHASGDLLLRQFALRLRRCLRTDDIVARLAKTCRPALARLGGDEFTILLPGIDNADQAGTVALRVLDALKRPFDLGHQVVSVGASIGVALYPDHANDPAALLRLADAAMYEAKDQHRSTFRIYGDGGNVREVAARRPAAECMNAVSLAS